MSKQTSVPTGICPDHHNTDASRRGRGSRHQRSGVEPIRQWVVTGSTALIAALALAASGCGASTTTNDQKADAKGLVASIAPEPKSAAVPSLVGLSRADAAAALRDAGSDDRRGDPPAVDARRLAPSSNRGPRPAPRSTPGRRSRVVLAAPLPTVPDVSGQARAAAVSQLKAAGFRVEISTKTTNSGEDNVVISESPSGGDRAKPGAVVALVVSDLHKPPTLSSAGSANCTPGYSPCLPPASDYDCEGGSGDGPKYTGLVHVTGSDPYDLDRDGDGIGCD